MHLYETKDGDIWICINCQTKETEMIEELNWEWIFEKDDATLRCALCKGPDFDFED